MPQLTAWEQFFLFAGESFLIVFAIIAVLAAIAILVAKGQHSPEMQIEKLHARFRKLRNQLESAAFTSKTLKAIHKDRKKKAAKEKNVEKKRAYVIDFKGDIKASAVDCFRDEITAVVQVAQPGDEVLVRVESPGGMVHGYGLAAAQLIRLREKKIPFTIAVDKVAASGGYMMACTADRIVAAPFAIVGSVGVVAQVPNFHKLLKKHDVEYKEYTAGEFKRTVSIFGEITAKGEEKFREQLEATHVLFKSFVQKYRPQLDVAKVATGEYWYGEQAIGLGLVDAIQTSDEWLLERVDSHLILQLKIQKKQALGEKLSGYLGRALQRGLTSAIEDLEARKYV